MNQIDEELSLCPSDVMIDDWVYDPENECYCTITSELPPPEGGGLLRTAS